MFVANIRHLYKKSNGIVWYAVEVCRVTHLCINIYISMFIHYYKRFAVADCICADPENREKCSLVFAVISIGGIINIQVRTKVG